MSIREHFAEQLADSIVCTGRYMPSLSREEAIQELKHGGRFTPPLTTSGETAEEYYDRKNLEFSQHEGERMLFFMREGPAVHAPATMKVEILSVWESDLEKVLEGYEIVPTRPRRDGPFFPKFRKKVAEVTQVCRSCGDTKLVEGLDFYGCSPSYETCGDCHCAPD